MSGANKLPIPFHQQCIKTMNIGQGKQSTKTNDAI